MKGYCAIKVDHTFEKEDPLVILEQEIQIINVLEVLRQLEVVQNTAKSMVTSFPNMFSLGHLAIVEQ
jgi:hypothetical protein